MSELHKPSNKAEMVTPRASARTLMALIDGFAPPVSIRDMYVLAKPHLSANASWLIPIASRISRMRRPNWCWSTGDDGGAGIPHSHEMCFNREHTNRDMPAV